MATCCQPIDEQMPDILFPKLFIDVYTYIHMYVCIRACTATTTTKTINKQPLESMYGLKIHEESHKNKSITTTDRPTDP